MGITKIRKQNFIIPHDSFIHSLDTIFGVSDATHTRWVAKMYWNCRRTRHPHFARLHTFGYNSIASVWRLCTIYILSSIQTRRWSFFFLHICILIGVHRDNTCTRRPNKRKTINCCSFIGSGTVLIRYQSSTHRCSILNDILFILFCDFFYIQLVSILTRILFCNR